MLAEEHGYREYDLYAYCKQWNKKGHFLSIGARISQRIATRAFQATEEYRKGIRGKPRFKGIRGLNSIEDNSIDANLRLKNKIIYYLGLELPLLYDPRDPVHHHGLNSRIKYVRLVRRNFNGRIRYFAQLICEGKPLIKPQHKAQKGEVGLDIGPSTIAIVSEQKKYAKIQVFADELKVHKKKRHKLERKIARRLRLGNPEAYEANRWIKKDKHWHHKQGKSIQGKRPSHRSKSLQKTFDQLADMARRQAAHRKVQHGRLVNEILQVGDHIKTEKLSYKAFQKLFGSSVGLRAPGMFVETLRRKAENAGGKVEDINTYRTKLSQACHCGRYEKKGLNARWKVCPCGVEAQRDLFSAYLACFVEKDTLMEDQAQKAWSGMDIALRTAMSELKRSIRGPVPSSLGL
jgi:putative transposase